MVFQSVVTEAPKCNIEVTDESGMEFSCKYYGSERVNFSRGKQIADLALNKLKTANNHAPCNILIKEKEFLICNETQDFAMVPYDKITYQGMRLYFSLKSRSHLLRRVSKMTMSQSQSDFKVSVWNPF